jgi:Iap family predicted aminopeptidase
VSGAAEGSQELLLLENELEQDESEDEDELNELELENEELENEELELELELGGPYSISTSISERSTSSDGAFDLTKIFRSASSASVLTVLTQGVYSFPQVPSDAPASGKLGVVVDPIRLAPS